MSDYIKRLEFFAYVLAQHGAVYEDLPVLAHDAAQHAQDLRSLLSDVERMRGALGWIEDHEPATQELSLAHEMAQLARQALSAPNTEEGE